MQFCPMSKVVSTIEDNRATFSTIEDNRATLWAIVSIAREAQISSLIGVP